MGPWIEALGQGVAPPPPPPSFEEPIRGLPQDVVIVSGTAGIEMVPDLVMFSVAVHTEGAAIRPIAIENNKKVQRILSEFKSRGVKAQELRTSEFRLTPVERDDQFVGYRVTNEIGVARQGLTDVGELIAAAIDAGANDVTGPQFSVRNEKLVQDRCLESAFGDARRKAQRLAALAERRLGKVLAATDGSSSPFEMKYRTPGVEAGVLGGIGIEPGVHLVECGVTVAFQLQ